MVGCVYAVETFEGIFSVRYAGDLIVPEQISSLSLIKETLHLLYSLKHHHLNMIKQIQSAAEKAKIDAQLSKLRPPNDDQKKIAPAFFFSPTAKRQLASRSNQ